MATNIELKARYKDLAQAESLATQLGAKLSGVLRQTDTYFRSINGRLKLREINGEQAELIHYHRPNDADIRKSEYTILNLSPVQGRLLVDQLSAAVGILVVVRKCRQLLLWNDVRIHLDQVENLGNFIEFEGLVGTLCNEIEAAAKVEALTRALEIAPQDQISTSYSDLLIAAG